MQYHARKVQTKLQREAIFVCECFVDAELLRRQDGNAEDGLNEEEEECLEVVLGLLL